jgi:hypothetical protein
MQRRATVFGWWKRCILPASTSDISATFGTACPSSPFFCRLSLTAGEWCSQCVESTDLKMMLLVEMLARLLKTQIRQSLRETMRKLKVPLEQPYRRLVVDYLNLVFGESAKSDRYWDLRLKKKLLQKFARALTPAETLVGHNLKKALASWSMPQQKSGRQMLFEKLRSMVGLQFAPIVATQCDNNVQFFHTAQPVRAVPDALPVRSESGRMRVCSWITLIWRSCANASSTRTSWRTRRATCSR